MRTAIKTNLNIQRNTVKRTYCIIKYFTIFVVRKTKHTIEYEKSIIGNSLRGFRRNFFRPGSRRR